MCNVHICLVLLNWLLLHFCLQSELEIEPRYPLFGGWKATFVIGYGLPLEDFLFESPDGRRYLNFSFGCPLVETVVDKLTIKVSFFPALVTCGSYEISYGAMRFCCKSTYCIFLSQVVLPEGSLDPSVVVPFPVKEYLEVFVSLIISNSVEKLSACLYKLSHGMHSTPFLIGASHYLSNCRRSIPTLMLLEGQWWF